jgi:hypothetical protein
MQKLIFLTVLVFYVIPLIFCFLVDVREREKPANHCYIPVLNAYLMGFVIYYQISDKLTLYIRYGTYRFCRMMIRYYFRKKNFSKMHKWAEISVRNDDRAKDLGDRQRERLR